MVAHTMVRTYTAALALSIAAFAGGRPDGEEGESCGCGIDSDIPRVKAAASEGLPSSVVLETGMIEDMKFIQGGLGFIGTDNPAIWRDGEGPRRHVQLSSFLIDTHEVTNHGTSHYHSQVCSMQTFHDCVR